MIQGKLQHLYLIIDYAILNLLDITRALSLIWFLEFIWFLLDCLFIKISRNPLNVVILRSMHLIWAIY